LTFEVKVKVFDLTVEKDHSYCVGENVLAAHNCSTFNQTSFGSPMFSAALESGKWAKIPVILDGGIREPGDIARAMIGFMANQGEYKDWDATCKTYSRPLNIPMVMIGSLFAACVDAPGESIYGNAKVYRSDIGIRESKGEITHKRYYGSASAESKKKTGQEVKHIEGKSIEIPCNGMTYAEFYESLKEAVQSQISYGGGRDLSCFKDVQWRVIS
jgi:IMP dehydrogenase/GMP reductase